MTLRLGRAPGFYGVSAPAAQQSAGPDLTDNSGGAGNDTIVAIPALSATPLLLADAPTTTECNTVIDTIRDGVADLARKVNQVKNALEAYGLLSPT